MPSYPSRWARPSRRTIWRVPLPIPGLASAIVSLFIAKFDPDRDPGLAAEVDVIEADIITRLEDVMNPDEDRIFARLPQSGSVDIAHQLLPVWCGWKSETVSVGQIQFRHDRRFAPAASVAGNLCLFPAGRSCPSARFLETGTDVMHKTNLITPSLLS